jgi:putative tricarboxylic transport membrane protein
MSPRSCPRALSRRAAEVGFALFAIAVAATIMLGARELDTGWSRSGPEAGYFPFRVGLLLAAAAAIVLVRALLARDASPGLVTGAQAGRMARFALPLAAFAVLAPVLGFYPAIALYVVVAVGLVGRVFWRTTIAIALLLPAGLFVVFERLFRMPLPKGPLGPLLGLW